MSNEGSCFEQKYKQFLKKAVPFDCLNCCLVYGQEQKDVPLTNDDKVKRVVSMPIKPQISLFLPV